MKKLIVAVTFAVSLLLVGCSKADLYIYNWGEYIDPEVIDMFEEEYGVKVAYSTFESNEIMYTKIKSESANYDVVIPSDYMIEKMIKEDLIQKLDLEKITNIKEVGQDYLDKSKVFDPNNEYSVPYFWGTVGILYDTTKVTETVDSWDILWNNNYEDEIYMYDSQRDSLMVALKLLGYSMNTTDETELEAAKNKLIDQKPLVLTYVTDQVIDSMIAGDAALAVVYSGDAAYIMDENENMEYAIPKEGTNFWIDSMVIPKNAKNPDLAHKFIDFMCRPDIAQMNTEYVMYSTPITETFEAIKDEEWTMNEAYNPGSEIINSDLIEVFRDPGTFIDEYNRIWEEVKAN